MGLAICVFAWGLQYKLSLYDLPQTTAPHVPMAKLLSRDEQPEASKTSLHLAENLLARALPAASSAGILFLLLTVCMRAMLARGRLRFPANPLWQARRATVDAYFDRPPPALA